MTHPLQAAPTRTYLSQLRTMVENKEKVHPVRASILKYLERRGGTTKFLGDAKALLARTRLHGLGTILSPTTRAPIIEELVAWTLTLTELMADEPAGCALSLADLVGCGTISTMADLIPLKATLDDLIGPFQTATRRTRLNPTILVEKLGGVIKFLKEEPFNLTSTLLIKYAMFGTLYPSDFRALGLSFDVPRMSDQEIVDVLIKKAAAMLVRFPQDDWVQQAGLTDVYLKRLFPRYSLATIKNQLNWK